MDIGNYPSHYTSLLYLLAQTMNENCAGGGFSPKCVDELIHGRETKSVAPIDCVHITRKFACSNCAKFRKADSAISIYNSNFYTCTIICGVKVMPFSTTLFSIVLSCLLRYSWNHLKYRNSMSVLKSQKR